MCDIVEREDMSLEQFIMLAMAEKASAIATEAFLEARAEQGSKEKFLAAMGEGGRRRAAGQAGSNVMSVYSGLLQITGASGEVSVC